MARDSKQLVDMSRGPGEGDEAIAPAQDPGEEPRYDYGLSLHLDDSALAKLGLDERMPQVGDEKIIRARVRVTSVSERDTQGGTDQTADLQITHMRCEDAPATAEDAVEQGVRDGSRYG